MSLEPGRPNEPVFIGLGSNLTSRFGGRRATLKAALGLINDLDMVSLTRASGFYETVPVGPQDQGLFINAAAELSTTLPPLELLDRLLALESEMGRVRERHWGPRVIDLDILLWGTRVIDHERLAIPHPEMAGREFVLAPLAEIGPEAVHPVLGRTMADLRAQVPDQGVRALAEDE